MHNLVVHGVGPDDSPLKSRQERLLELRIMGALAEYRLVKNGAATYQALGYALPAGQAPAIKMLEFLAIDSAMADALDEKRSRK